MKLKHKIYFVAATGTDIGKTYFVEQVIGHFKRQAVACRAIKPIISGFCDKDKNSDTAKIIQSLGDDFHLDNIHKISPWRFRDPVSPNVAAKNEGCEIDFAQVVAFCQKNIAKAQLQDEYLLIEAAGGIMTPITDDKTFLDLVMALKIPVLLLGGNYLGSISHSLCAIEVLKSRKIDIEYCIVNDHPEVESSLDPSQTATIISNISNIDTVTMDVFLD